MEFTCLRLKVYHILAVCNICISVCFGSDTLAPVDIRNNRRNLTLVGSISFSFLEQTEEIIRHLFVSYGRNLSWKKGYTNRT